MSKIWLVTVVGLDFKLLPKFLQYYKNLGIKNFLVITHYSNEKSNLREIAKYILNSSNLPRLVHKEWIGPFSEKLKVDNERKIINENCTFDDWIIYADIDEFQEYPEGLRNTIKKCDNKKKTFLEGRMIDRIASNGYLLEYTPSIPLEQQYPLGGQITYNLLKAWDKKIVAAKAARKVGGGHHVFLRNTPLNGWYTYPYKRGISWRSRKIKVHHFKWDAKVIERMKAERTLPHKSLKSWRGEINRFLAYYDKFGYINVKNRKFKITYINSVLNI